MTVIKSYMTLLAHIWENESQTELKRLQLTQNSVSKNLSVLEGMTPANTLYSNSLPECRLNDFGEELKLIHKLKGYINMR